MPHAKSAKKTGPKFLKSGTSTGISIEKELLQKIQNRAFKCRMSMSAWLSVAAEEKLAASK